MIVHDWTCESGHLFERAVDVAELATQRCEVCDTPATVTFLPKRFSHAPNTVFYKNAEGKRLYPWDSRDLPKTYTDLGYTRREVSGFERTRFERSTRQQMNAEGNREREQQAEQFAADRDARHADLRHVSSNWGDFQREVAREAMRDENGGYSQSAYDSCFQVGE